MLLNNRKAQMSTGKSVSLILGILFIALGLIPILNSFKIIGFAIPPLPALVIQVLLIVGGLWLVYDGMKLGMGAFGFAQNLMMGSYVLGVAALALGLIPLLNGLGFIGFTLPSIGQAIINYIYLAVGVLLILDYTQILM